MDWRDKYKGKRRKEDPAMVDFEHLKNSAVVLNQTNRNKTIVRADELDGVSVRQNLVKEGPPVPPSGRTLFRLAPGVKRVTFDNVCVTNCSGFDSLVSGADAEYLVVNGCTMDTGGSSPRRAIFPPPSVPSVPSLEQQRRSGKVIGRNQPCPCGGGKKYKHCHGKIA